MKAGLLDDVRLEGSVVVDVGVAAFGGVVDDDDSGVDERSVAFVDGRRSMISVRASASRHLTCTKSPTCREWGMEICKSVSYRRVEARGEALSLRTSGAVDMMLLADLCVGGAAAVDRSLVGVGGDW
jgi:hypothetical protein